MATLHRFLAVLVVSMVVATCGPSKPDQTPPPSHLTVTGVRIEGPASVAPGASASYRFLVTRSDGTTADVTSQSTWTSSNDSVLPVQGPGAVRGARRGEAVLFARNFTLQPAQFQTGNLPVLVLEDGTFRVTGRVQESGAGAGLQGARVDVVSGTGTGQSDTTRSGGSYVLYGLAGDVQIDATLDGFQRERRTLRVGENTSADITMRPTITPTDLNGIWTMTLMVSAGCVPAFPEDASSRSYTATVSQTGTALQLDVSAPQVATSRLDGLVIDRSLTLFLPSFEPYSQPYYPIYMVSYSLIEELGPKRFLAIAGTVTGQRDGDAVTGRLSGHFAIYASHRDTLVWQQEWSCRRDDHEFRLDRK